MFLCNSVYSSPADEAVAFLNDVKSGNLSRAVKRFGGNVCRCPAKGGWGSYLIYISAQEPNLAFMVGKDFSMGKAAVDRLDRKTSYVLPWEKPEDTIVDIPITFDEKKYLPLFLPLKMAYGHKMTEKEFSDFVANPDTEAWKGFYLRLRPTTEPGALRPPEGAITPDAEMEFEALKKDKIKAFDDKKVDSEAERKEREKRESDSQKEIQELKELFGEEAASYIEPKDPGPVIMSDGTEMPRERVSEMLPRLKSTLMRLHVVRRGQLKDWTIYHFGMMENVMRLNDGRELKLVHDRPPGYSEEKIRPVFKDEKP